MEEEMIKPWKVVNSRYLAEKPWFTVREERVQLPNGNEIPNYYVFEYPDWVNVIAVTVDGKYVFERQYRHAVGLVSYELCAGVCEPDDASPLEAARRELLEETGYGNGEWEELMILSPNPGYCISNLTYCYLLGMWNGRKSASRTYRGYCRRVAFSRRGAGFARLQWGIAGFTCRAVVEIYFYVVGRKSLMCRLFSYK